MVISIAPGTQIAAKTQPGKLNDLNWDPITHIVGSLGIYTSIDFENAVSPVLVRQWHIRSSTLARFQRRSMRASPVAWPRR